MDDPPPAVDVDERAELGRLRREVAELRLDREFLKKCGGFLRCRELEPAEAFELMDAEKARFSLSRMAALLGVSRQGYYKWVARKTTELGVRARRRAELLAQVVVSHRAPDEVSGAPWILADLRDAGVQVSRKTVSKLMQENGIRGISPRPWQPVTTAQGACARDPGSGRTAVRPGRVEHGGDLGHHLSGHRRGLVVFVRGAGRAFPPGHRLRVF
ncbi:IS3 family transposase [Nakamurella sp. YIM 132087]|uniref:IS3 family transposase n=1 Tax=Nakamurella alba TaxID=2665158 RepID=A0A7K1FKP9_9ACTN|nr:IS3 family transposase [Nakamurella alba]MTD14666.1 IS3 family transposase [Nakamurella alba]